MSKVEPQVLHHKKSDDETDEDTDYDESGDDDTDDSDTSVVGKSNVTTTSSANGLIKEASSTQKQRSSKSRSSRSKNPSSSSSSKLQKKSHKKKSSSRRKHDVLTSPPPPPHTPISSTSSSSSSSNPSSSNPSSSSSSKSKKTHSSPKITTHAPSPSPSSSSSSSSASSLDKKKKIEDALKAWSGNDHVRINTAVSAWAGIPDIAQAQDPTEISGVVSKYLSGRAASLPRQSSSPASLSRGSSRGKFSFLQETLTRRKASKLKHPNSTSPRSRPRSSTGYAPPSNLDNPTIDSNSPSSSSSSSSQSPTSSSSSSSSNHNNHNDNNITSSPVVTFEKPGLPASQSTPALPSQQSAQQQLYSQAIAALKTDDQQQLVALLKKQDLAQLPMLVPDAVVFGATRCLQWSLSHGAPSSSGVLFNACAGVDPQKAAQLPPTTLLPIELGIVFDRFEAVRLLVRHTDASWFGTDLYMRVYRMAKFQALLGLMLSPDVPIQPTDSFLSLLIREQPAFFYQLLKEHYAAVYQKKTDRSLLYPVCRSCDLSSRLVSNLLKKAKISLASPVSADLPPLHLVLSPTDLHVPAHKRFSSAKVLIRLGAGVSQPCSGDGRTPLHVACIHSFSTLRRDLIDLLLRYDADACLADRHGLLPHDYANPLTAAWIRGAIYPPEREFFSQVPTLKHLCLTRLRQSYVRLKEAAGGRFLVSLADIDEQLLWAFVKPPIPVFTWISGIPDDNPKKVALANLVYRKLSIWDHQSTVLASCFQMRMHGRPSWPEQGQNASSSTASESPIEHPCGCTLSCMIRFRDCSLSGQVSVELDMGAGRLTLQYGASARDLLKTPALMQRYLAGLGLDPEEDQLVAIVLFVSVLPSLCLHLGSFMFRDILALAQRVSNIQTPPPQWFLDAIAAMDQDRSRPLYLPPVAKRDNGVLITDSATFELSSGKIQFIEPSLDSRSEEESEEGSSSELQEDVNFSSSDLSD